MVKKRVNISLSENDHAKAKQDSKKMYDEENVSRLIGYLIKNHKSKKKHNP